jgi:hypothetical protein
LGNRLRRLFGGNRRTRWLRLVVALNLAGRCAGSWLWAFVRFLSLLYLLASGILDGLCRGALVVLPLKECDTGR